LLRVKGGVEKGEVFFFSKGLGPSDPFAELESSIDDLGSCWGVAPIPQEFEFKSCGGFSGIDDEMANGWGNIDSRE
jgi:hypothetical protein